MDDALRHLYLGFIRHHVLYRTGKESVCGIELMEELRHRGFDVGPGTIYPMPHYLEADGLLNYSDK